MWTKLFTIGPNGEKTEIGYRYFECDEEEGIEEEIALLSVEYGVKLTFEIIDAPPIRWVELEIQRLVQQRYDITDQIHFLENVLLEVEV